MYKKFLITVIFCLNMQLVAIYNFAFANSEDDMEALKKEIIFMKETYQDKR